MKAKYIFLLLFISPLFVLGQGFKGKTLSITPNISAIYLGGNGEKLTDDIDPIIGLDIEKALNRSSSLGLRLNYMLPTYVGWEYRNSSDRLNGKIKGSGLGLYYKRYFSGRGAIAPLGPWFEFGGSTHSYSSTNTAGELISGIRSFAARAAFGANWFLGPNVLLYAAIEGKYEQMSENSESLFGSRDQTLSYFQDKLLFANVVTVKLGITIPIL